jgi:hypothetical protein
MADNTPLSSGGQKPLEEINNRIQEKIEQTSSQVGELFKHWESLTLISHWHKLFENFQESPQRIYSLIEEAIDRRKIPDVKVSRISYAEAGALSASREYLRVQRSEHTFDICAAPFGTGFFTSWWLGKKEKSFWPIAILIFVSVMIVGLIIKLVLISLVVGLVSVLLWWLSLRQTYYKLDTALMFQDSVHSAVLEVIGQATEGKGQRVMTELERKPIMNDLFKRKL